MKKLITSSLLFLSLAVFGQEGSKKFSVEVDPAPYMLNGYSVSLKYSPKKCQRLRLWVLFTSQTFPIL
jgi:hypothetical protein